MVNRELDYIDFRDYDALRQYVDEAPSPAPGTQTRPTEPAEVFVMPQQPSRPRGRPRKNTEPQTTQQKRRYVRITNQQRKNLIAAFREHGDDMPPVWYSTTIGIKLTNVANLLVKLRRGESIMPKGYYNRKSRVIPFQHLLRREIELDPTVPMRVVREDLAAIVERHGGNVEVLGPEVVDEAVRLRREGRPEADAAGRPAVDGEDMFVDEDAAVEDSPTQDVWIPSVAALNAFLRGESGMDVTREIPVFTMKRETVRGARATRPRTRRSGTTRSSRCRGR